jgi:hypothetical protein
VAAVVVTGRAYSVPEALRQITTVSLSSTDPDHYSCVIYGAGGMNRWIVTGDGTVSFSQWHCHHRPTLRQVPELGVALFWHLLALLSTDFHPQRLSRNSRLALAAEWKGGGYHAART